MKSLLITLFILLPIGLCQGQTFFRLVSEKDVFENKKKATVTFTTYYNGEQVNYGSGFFIDKKGTILTNKHVFLKEFILNNPKTTIEVKTSDGKYLKDLKIMRCGNKNKIDLCVLKTDSYRPKAYFKPSLEPLGLGHKVYYIGHCKGPWTLRKGKVKKIYKNFLNQHNIFNFNENKNTEMIEVTTDVCEGDSGSAIYSPINGALKGIVTLYFHKGKSKRWNLGITTKEIISFLKLKRKNVSIPGYQIVKAKGKEKAQ